MQNHPTVNLGPGEQPPGGGWCWVSSSSLLPRPGLLAQAPSHKQERFRDLRWAHNTSIFSPLWLGRQHPHFLDEETESVQGWLEAGSSQPQDGQGTATTVPPSAGGEAVVGAPAKGLCALPCQGQLPNGPASPKGRALASTDGVVARLLMPQASSGGSSCSKHHGPFPKTAKKVKSSEVHLASQSGKKLVWKEAMALQGLWGPQCLPLR